MDGRRVGKTEDRKGEEERETKEKKEEERRIEGRSEEKEEENVLLQEGLDFTKMKY